MKSIFFKFVLGFVFLSNALSADIDKLLEYSRFDIGPEYIRLNLHIHSTATAEGEHLRGNIWGESAALEYKEPSGIYANLNTYYVKNPIVSHHPHDKRLFREMRIEGRFGYNFVFGCNKEWVITPYTGFAFARISQSHVGPLSLFLLAPTYYVPIGVLAIYKIKDYFSAGVNLRYMPQVDATFKFSNIPNARWKLVDRYSFTAELPLVYSYQFCCCQYPIKGTVSLVPYWRILEKGHGKARSITGAEVLIPAQTYYFLGLKLLFGINF